MLCTECEHICLDFGKRHPRTAGSEHAVRLYCGFEELRSAERECDFCAIVFERISWIERGKGYREEVGSDVYDDALRRCRISVFHLDPDDYHHLEVEWRLDYHKVSGTQESDSSGAGSRHFLGSIYVENNSPLASKIAGRPYDVGLSKEGMIELARGWYRDCKAGHTPCADSTARDFVPTRLIDLASSGEAGRFRLIHPSRGFSAPYVALSYCWGQTVSFTLTHETLPILLDEGVEYDQLPRAIRDACELSRALGIRYLWVDCLCILQGAEGTEDWRRESALMGKLYTQAEFTIRAAGGRHADVPLFGRRSWIADRAAQLQGTINGRDRVQCHLRAAMEWAQESLDKRGWALQESTSPRRVLNFGKAQMWWDCCQSCWNESGDHSNTVIGANFLFQRPMRARPEWFEDDSRITFQDFQGAGHTEAFATFWKWLVQEYCRRDLSFHRDKLPAISGLAGLCAQQSSLSGAGEYLAGLWKPHLPTGLLWRHMFPSPVEYANLDHFRAPSWSWASLDWYHLEWCSEPGPEVAIVRNAEVTCLTGDPFGEVINGFIDLHVPCKRGWIARERRSRSELCELWADERPQETPQANRSRCPALAWVYFDRLDDVSSSASNHDEPGAAKHLMCLRVTRFCGLVVDEITTVDEAQCSTYRRLGVYTSIPQYLQSYDSPLQDQASPDEEWWEDAEWVNVRLL